MHSQTNSKTVLRPHLARPILGLFVIPFMLGMSGIAASLPFVVPPDPIRIAFAIGFSVFSLTLFLFCVVSGCYFIVEYFRYRLTLDAHQIIHRGLFSTTTIRCEDIEEVVWRKWRCGKIASKYVVVQANNSKIKIDLTDVFSDVGNKRVVSFLRERILPEYHKGWEEFDEPPPPDSPRPKPSPFANVLAAVVFFLAGLPFAYVWLIGWGATYLACNLVLSAGGVFFGFRAWYFLVYAREEDA